MVPRDDRLSSRFSIVPFVVLWKKGSPIYKINNNNNPGAIGWSKKIISILGVRQNKEGASLAFLLVLSRSQHTQHTHNTFIPVWC